MKNFWDVVAMILLLSALGFLIDPGALGAKAGELISAFNGSK